MQEEIEQPDGMLIAQQITYIPYSDAGMSYRWKIMWVCPCGHHDHCCEVQLKNAVYTCSGCKKSIYVEVEK